MGRGVKPHTFSVFSSADSTQHSLSVLLPWMLVNHCWEAASRGGVPPSVLLMVPPKASSPVSGFEWGDKKAEHGWSLSYGFSP